MEIARTSLWGFYCRKGAPWTQATTDWKHLYGSKIIKSWIFHFSKQKRITIGQAIWTLFFYYLFPKSFLTELNYQQLREKLSRIIYPKWNSWFSVYFVVTLCCFFLNVDESLRDYSSPLNIQNKANSRRNLANVSFFHMIPFKALENLKTVEESRTKVQFDHHCVKTNTQAFFGWQTKVIV